MRFLSEPCVNIFAKSFVKPVYVFAIVILFGTNCYSKKYDKSELKVLREEVRQMFQHAYNSYLKYAYPYDELRPLSCDGVDTWGSYSLTLIDALDTLAVMGNYSEFQRVVDIVTTHANFDANINVSVFETNIRIIGGLLSAHLLSYRAGVAVEPGWPCNGPLLQLAEDMARRLLAAFDTVTGMPYGTVNLRNGVPEGETSVTCTAGVGTFILEMGTLSRLTGDPVFEEVAMNALYSLYHHRSAIGLVGNHIDVQTGRWTAQDAGIGAGVDSYYEYLAKGAILLQRPELMHMFQEGRQAIDKYLSRDDWHLWVSMSKGQVTLPVFQSLEAYWPGVLSLIGEVGKGMKSLHNYHQVWKQYGFTPEFYNIPQGEVGANREGYPLRPELVESVMYLYRATGDPYLIEVGKDILRSIQHSARTPCGYATIKDVRDHRKEDRMESFFLAETTKYLYLLFDPDNFIHNQGQQGTLIKTPWGECVIESGGYIFNTEAHPIDPGALHCCSGHRESDIRDMLSNTDTRTFRGEQLATHRNQKLDQELQHEMPAKSNGSSTAPVGSTSEDSELLKKQRHEMLVQLFSELKEKLGRDDKIDDNESEPVSEALPEENSNSSTQLSEQDESRIVEEEEVVDKDGKDVVKVNDGVSQKPERDEEPLEYRVDDSDRVFPIRDLGSIDPPSFTAQTGAPDQVEADNLSDQQHDSWEKGQIREVDQSTLSSAVNDLFLTQTLPKPPFDPQVLIERLRLEARYRRNASWEQNFGMLSCEAQPFLQRLSMSGEIFGVS